MTKHKKRWLPKRLLWRLTLTNTVIIGFFIVLSGLAIYSTACMLADGMGALKSANQAKFNATLYQYLWIFSISAIVIGSFVHFYLTKVLINPLRDLIDSTRRMKEGQYPEPIEEPSADEIGQLIVHFNDLVQQLKANQEHRQKLVSDLSHEFRTPLSNLNGYLSALKNGVMTGDETLYQSLHMEVERLIQMMDQLDQLKEWDYVKEQTFAEKESIRMDELANQSIEMFRWTMQRSGIEWEVELDTGTVSANKKAISQVLSNLLDNAIRYYSGEASIFIKGEIRHSEYMMLVTGPGNTIPESEQAYLFDRFYRADPSRTRETGGTGLGLAISREIIEHHNGEIGMFSDDHLHTFWFTLPLIYS